MNGLINLWPMFLSYQTNQLPYSVLMDSICLTPAGISLFKVNNKNITTICEICSVLTINTPERRLEVVLVSLSLTLNRLPTFFFGVSIFDFEQVNAG